MEGVCNEVLVGAAEGVVDVVGGDEVWCGVVRGDCGP